MIASIPVLTVFTVAGILLGLVLLAGLVAGQFRRGVVDELRATLQTAKTEIDVERSRSDRLEREAQALRSEVAALRAEVKTLRSVLTDGQQLAAQVAETLARQNDQRSNRMVEDIKEALGMQTVRILENLEKRRDA